MITVEFKNVGRNKLAYSARMRTISEESILRQARRHLMSRNIEIGFDESGLAGKIYAGGREAGTFQARLS